MSACLTEIKNIYLACRGFHTKRKLLVIESDDWGSIRMPDKKTFESLKLMGDCPQDDAFLSNDCLENTSDLEALYRVLTSVHDSKGNPAIVTANFAVANPDFEKINYSDDIYKYEIFTDTYKRYYPDENVLSVVLNGIKIGCFCPQLHCREHLNVNRWLKDLKRGNSYTKMAFENLLIGVGKSFTPDNRFGYMDAFNTDYNTDEELEKIIRDASSIFCSVFGYASSTFVASCFVWSDALEQHLNSVGIKGIQSASWQNVPMKKNDQNVFKRRMRYSGQKNKMGQIYNVRNCSYEPAYFQNPDKCADDCFEQVKRAFSFGKPAVINSHRFNYIGSINPQNSANNLICLERLLERIVKEFPDVEFLSTPQLIDLMKRG